MTNWELHACQTQTLMCCYAIDVITLHGGRFQNGRAVEDLCLHWLGVVNVSCCALCATTTRLTAASLRHRSRSVSRVLPHHTTTQHTVTRNLHSRPAEGLVLMSYTVQAAEAHRSDTSQTHLWSFTLFHVDDCTLAEWIYYLCGQVWAVH